VEVLFHPQEIGVQIIPEEAEVEAGDGHQEIMLVEVGPFLNQDEVEVEEEEIMEVQMIDQDQDL